MCKRTIGLVLLGTLMLALLACTPAAAPTPTPTKAPAAAPTQAPPAAAPTKAAEPAKPPAPTPTTAPAATPTPKPVTLKWGTARILPDAPIFWMMERGYFQQEGITLELTSMGLAAEAIASLSTGQLDLMNVSVGPAILNAIERGADVRWVMEVSHSSPGNDWMGIVLRKDVADSGRVKTAADLKGMKVGINAQATTGEQAFEALLGQAGLKMDKDVEVVLFPFPNLTAALENKAVDVAFAAEPMMSIAVQQGFGKRWMGISSLFDGYLQTGGLAFGKNLLTDRDLGRRFAVALVKGARAYSPFLASKDSRKEMIQLFVKHMGVKDTSAYETMELSTIDPDARLAPQSLDKQYSWMVSKGYYGGKVKLTDAVDNSFTDFAVQKLGKP